MWCYFFYIVFFHCALTTIVSVFVRGVVFVTIVVSVIDAMVVVWCRTNLIYFCSNYSGYVQDDFARTK